MVALLLLACSCHKDEPEVPVPAPVPVPVTAPAPEPVDEVAAVHRALSTRDGLPSCTDLAPMMTDPVATLTTLVNEYTMPPQVPMLAANCLVEGHAEAASELIVSWMGDPAKKGFALLVIGKLEDLPLEVATRAAEAGLGGPAGAELTEALAASERPELQALAP
jgi:hypothetical protein